jgi:hypothetical protein
MRRALLIGINYLGTSSQLNGCINDINNVGSYLYNTRKYNSFIVLTDYTRVKPTKANILMAFNVLFTNVRAGDELWFHYSGHGSLLRDTNRDEESGFDSCICPIDYERSGFISDDVIRQMLAQRVPKGVKLYIVLDACHSGTGCDLRYKYDDNSYLTNKPVSASASASASTPLPSKYIPNDWSLQQTSYEFKKYSKTNGEVYSISGCQDDQTSADAFIEGQATGALTFILLSCLRANSPTTYKWKHLLKDICCSEKIRGFTQKTCITSGTPINLEDGVFSTTPTTPSRSIVLQNSQPLSESNNILGFSNKTLTSKRSLHNHHTLSKIVLTN